MLYECQAIEKLYLRLQGTTISTNHMFLEVMCSVGQYQCQMLFIHLYFLGISIIHVSQGARDSWLEKTFQHHIFAMAHNWDIQVEESKQFGIDVMTNATHNTVRMLSVLEMWHP